MTTTELRHHWHQTALEDWHDLKDECLTFKPVRLPSEWAAEERRIAAGQSPMAGFADIPYDHAVMPHCVEQMDSVDEPGVRELVIWGAIRDGKTLSVCLNIMGRTVRDKPCNIYDVNPTDDDAARFSESDVEGMIALCLEDVFVDKKSRESGRTIEFKKFAGGWLRIISSGSITKFRGTSVGVLFLHELDALNKESIYKAINRTQGFARPIIVKESTCTLAAVEKEDGTLEYRSNIHEAFDRGDKRKWFVPCRECGKFQVILIGGIQYPKGEMEKAAYHCKFCDTPHNENQWRRMQARGKWFPTAGLSDEQENDIEKWWNTASPKDPGVRSYWRNGFNSLLPRNEAYRTKLHQFVAEEIDSRSSPEARKTWTNEIAAELWDDSGAETPPPWKPILDNREDYATDERVIVPMRGLIITCFTDIHGNRLEVDWRAFSKDEESWGLSHFVLDGDTNRPEVWQQWTQHLARKWTHESGLEMQMSIAFVDGGWRADPVLATLNRLARVPVAGVSGKIRASKGVGDSSMIVHRTWATISNKLKGVHIGTWRAKELIYERLNWHGAEKPADPDAPRPGFIHFGKCYTEAFIRQCVNEKPIQKVINGRSVLTFKNPEGTRNEGIDMLVAELAAYRYRKWDYEAVDRQIEALRATPGEQPVVEPVKLSIKQVGGW